jgi:hypothetical protein
VIPFALDIEWCDGKWDPDGIGMTPLVRVLTCAVDDQRLHGAGECHYWKGAADRALLR